MTQRSKVRAAGLTAMGGDKLFTFYLIGIDPLLELPDSPLAPRIVAAAKSVAPCDAGPEPGRYN